MSEQQKSSPCHPSRRFSLITPGALKRNARAEVSESCWGAIQTMDTEDLMKLATMEVDVFSLIKKEIASRGRGMRGDWVGFEQARKEWGVA